MHTTNVCTIRWVHHTTVTFYEISEHQGSQELVSNPMVGGYDQYLGDYAQVQTVSFEEERQTTSAPPLYMTIPQDPSS